MVIQVCISSSCYAKGSYNIINKLTQLIKEKNLEDKISIKATFCFDECSKGVCIKFDEQIYSLSYQTIESFFNDIVIEKILKK